MCIKVWIRNTLSGFAGFIYKNLIDIYKKHLKLTNGIN